MKVSEKAYVVRNYIEDDASKIGEFNFMAMLAYQYNKDYETSNIFCAVDVEGHVLGVGHVVPDQTWYLLKESNQPEDFVCKLNVDLSINDHIANSEIVIDDLYEALLKRAKHLRAGYPSNKFSLNHVIESDDREEIDYYLSKGFVTKRNHLIMKRNLTEPIPTYELPNNITVKNWRMDTPEEQEQYLAAEDAGDEIGGAWSLNHLRWTKSGSEWDTFTAFAGDQVVGSVMTWGLGEERSATESIFVLPEWRRKGIAKAIITKALKFLREEKGKTEATLGVFGDNAKAIALYQSLGYRMLSINIEFGLEI